MAGLNPILFSKKKYGIGSKVAYFDGDKVKIGIIKTTACTSHNPFIEVESQEGDKVFMDWNNLYEVPSKLAKVI